MKQNIAYILSTGTLSLIWAFLGAWLATNTISSTAITTVLIWYGFLILWLVFTTIFIALIIRSQIR